MQFTNLNKLVRLFLLGSSAALFLAPALTSPVGGVVASLGLDKAGFAIPLGLIFLGLITALGCVVEGLSDCTLSRLVRWVAKNPDVARWFLKEEQATRVSGWQATFKKALVGTKRFPAAILTSDRERKSFAAAIFHKTAPADHLRHVDAHYGIFMLSSGLAVLFACLGTPVALSLLPASASNVNRAGVIAIFILCSYALCVQAIDNYLYTWEATFRYGCLWLWDESKAEKSTDSRRDGVLPRLRDVLDEAHALVRGLHFTVTNKQHVIAAALLGRLLEEVEGVYTMLNSPW